MPKINRRDYLIRMGAAAGAMASLPAVSVLGQPENSAHVDAANSGPGPSPQANLLRWVPTNEPPSLDAFVTAIFWGLMGFCYKTPTPPATAPPPAVEVGVHPGGNHHDFTIRIVKFVGSTPTVICTERPSRITTMRLKVISQAPSIPPKVFQKEPFNRVTGGDPLDFRWLPDLDGVDLYPEPYEKNRHFGPRLFVENGVFYTRMPTNSRFKLVRAEDDTIPLREFGNVARFMAAAIGVQNNDYVLFEINGVERCRFVKEDNVRYEITFKNECNHPSCPGPLTINDPDETKRNHFHFMRKVLKLSGDRIKYSLKISPPARPGAQLNFFDPDKDEKAFVTDEAPCAGAAFGQTNGFPT